MKTRHFSFISLLLSAPALMVLSGPLGGGCGGSSSTGNTTGAGGGGGSGGAILNPDDKLSDFEDIAAATIVNAGTPPRNGYWFTYSDESATCVTMPAKGATYVPSTPPTPSPRSERWHGAARCVGRLHGMGRRRRRRHRPARGGRWRQLRGCKVPYDLTGAKGITFWGMTSATADGKLRVKVNMRAETKKADACPVPGCPAATSPPFCDEAVVGMNKCSDAWGQTFTLPPAGNWFQVTILFSDAAKFKQESWGAAVPVESGRRDRHPDPVAGHRDGSALRLLDRRRLHHPVSRSQQHDEPPRPACFAARRARCFCPGENADEQPCSSLGPRVLPRRPGGVRLRRGERRRHAQRQRRQRRLRQHDRARRLRQHRAADQPVPGGVHRLPGQPRSPTALSPATRGRSSVRRGRAPPAARASSSRRRTRCSPTTGCARASASRPARGCTRSGCTPPTRPTTWSSTPATRRGRCPSRCGRR